MSWNLRKPAFAVRDLSALIGEGWLPGTVTAHRSGNVVMLDVSALGRTDPGTGTETILTLPSGFRPASHLYSRSFRGYRTRCQTSGNLAIDDPGQSVDYLFFTFITTDPMP